MRKAIALCMDKEALKDDYVGEFGVKSDGFYGLGQWMYQMVSGTIAQEPDEGMTEEEKEKLQEAWDEVTLEDQEKYEFDTGRANAILDAAGWTLNRTGGTFDSSKDDVRCKKIGEELIPLELKLIYPETTQIGEALDIWFAAPLKEAGILLTIETSPSVLPIYYGQDDTDYDMLYLATNFDVAFDPTQMFMEGGTVNVCGVKDEELVKLAGEMRQTEQGDLLTYCTKWISFLKRFTEVEPMIPVYSNVYYDFHPEVLQNYKITQYISWADAIVGSYFSDVAEEPAEAAE